MLQLDQRELQRNIRRMLKQATPEQWAEGEVWYQDAHTFARGLAERFGITLEQAAGVTAALSPNTFWPTNMDNAVKMCQTRKAPTFGGNVAKARAILDGADPLDVLGGPKTRAFYANIVAPDDMDGPATIDRHACDLACGLRRAGTYRRELRAVNGYQQLAAAFVAVARRMGLAACVVQAIAWVVWRDLAHAEVVATRKARGDYDRARDARGRYARAAA